jgi:hypothetical protein
MSKKLFILPALLGAFLMFSPACNDKDACEDVDCGVNGTCFEGDCQCDPGYELDADGQCNVLSQGKFTGTYAAAEQCSNGSDAYTVSIAPGASTDEILIANLFNTFGAIKATISEGGTSINIAPQQEGDQIFISGDGVWSSTGGSGGKPTLTIDFTVEDQGPNPAPTVTCTVVLTKN